MTYSVEIIVSTMAYKNNTKVIVTLVTGEDIIPYPKIKITCSEQFESWKALINVSKMDVYTNMVMSPNIETEINMTLRKLAEEDTINVFTFIVEDNPVYNDIVRTMTVSVDVDDIIISEKKIDIDDIDMTDTNYDILRKYYIKDVLDISETTEMAYGSSIISDESYIELMHQSYHAIGQIGQDSNNCNIAEQCENYTNRIMEIATNHMIEV